eukprot:3507000-Amphidinium_carterae.1
MGSVPLPKLLPRHMFLIICPTTVFRSENHPKESNTSENCIVLDVEAQKHYKTRHFGMSRLQVTT